jgi:hypothetical protein
MAILARSDEVQVTMSFGVDQSSSQSGFPYHLYLPIHSSNSCATRYQAVNDLGAYVVSVLPSHLADQ